MSTVLVANNGGHLKELHSLLPRLDDGGPRTWVTIDTPQSRSLLRGEECLWMRYARPRDVATTARNALRARPLFAGRRVRRVISTGSSLALAVLPQAVSHGVPALFLESATRSDGPSTTGRVLAVVPRVRLYTQHPHLADHRWRYAGCVYDGFAPGPVLSDRSGGRPLRVFVTLGSTASYPFPRLVARLCRILPADAEVFWQHGSTAVPPGSDGAAQIDVSEVDSRTAWADVVVAHGGAGSSLAALEAGRCPVLVPREAVHGEHIDDHQRQVAGVLADRGLAVVRRVTDLGLDDLLVAASRTVERVAQPSVLAW